MLSAPSVPQGTALPGASGEQGSDASTAEGSLLQSPDPPAVQKEPSVSSAPDGYVLMYFLSAGTYSLAYALEALFTAWLILALKLPYRWAKFLLILYFATSVLVVK